MSKKIEGEDAKWGTCRDARGAIGRDEENIQVDDAYFLS
jgi:hypothetical protein